MSRSLQETFDRVVTLIRETPVTSALPTTTTTDDKLRLYGLFKHGTAGPCSGTDFPSILKPQAYAKYQAWSKCQHMPKEQAMREYVLLAASQENWLGEKCQEMWTQCENRVSDDDAPIHPVNDTSSVAPGAVDFLFRDESEATTETTSSNDVSFLGIRSLVPRGQLDISYTDLGFAARVCCNMTSSMRRYRYYDKEISKQWKNATGRSSIVGLSVRSLFDLYLLAKQYPSGSEVIITPPINIPGMMKILQYHKLKVVGVDLPESSGDAPVVAVDCDAIEKAVTNGTVAILVVHPFGMVSATEPDMLRIGRFATDKKLDVLEDCAECFMGLGPDCYLGSPHSDVTFFSFGLIKTATALGAGVVVLRDESLCQSMTRLHFSLYKVQTSGEYLFKVIKSVILRLIADSPLLYALFAYLVSLLGWDFDTVVTPLLRSFNEEKSGGSEATNRFRLQLRRRPSPALLSVLHRRLDQSSNCTKSVARRVDRCRRMTRIIQKDELDVTVPHFRPDAQGTFWLYPIVTAQPRVTCRRLRAAGFDATQGASQLGCVASCDTCPRATHFMNSVCYLPIVSREIPEADMIRLARGLQTRNDDRESPVDSASAALQRKKIRGLISAAMLPIAVLFLTCGFCFEVLRVLSLAVVLLAVAVVLTSHLLQWSIASFYLDSSSGFATYSSMLIDRSVRSAGTDETHDIPSDTERSTVAKEIARLPSIIDSLKALAVPSIPNSGISKAVVLTGGTGFIGSAVLRDLLYHRRALSIDKVVLLCRSKRGISAESRIDRLLAGPVFDFLSSEDKESVIHVVEGEITKPNAGLLDDEISHIRDNFNITHILHCAASVSFTQKLPDAALANIASALNAQGLTALLGSKPAKFVHLSTAFVHGGLSGSMTNPLPEDLYSLGGYNPTEIYKSMMGTQFYASKAMNDLRFPNSYTFSKCICEHLLSLSVVDTTIIRPSIVGPAIECPFEGWAGEKPSTLIAGACLYFRFQFNLWHFSSHQVSCIPVDVLSRFVLAKAFNTGLVADERVQFETSDDSSSEDDFEKISKSSKNSCDLQEGPSDPSTGSHTVDERRIFTAAWDSTSNDTTTFTWTDYAVTITQVGAVLGYFSRPIAYVGLLFYTRLLPKVQLSIEGFERLHCSLVRRPFGICLRLCRLLGIDTTQATRLTPLIDLPVLFFPFTSTSFYFRSELTAPPEFSGDRYVFNCVITAHRFLAESSESTTLEASSEVSSAAPNQNISMLRIGGSTHENCSHDAWWALTQPRGGSLIRFAGWVLLKILRKTCSEVTVDAASFNLALKMLQNTKGSPHFVLAPTHRSFLDFLVLSFVCFSVPELQVELPSIAAAEDFERLPLLGRLAQALGAFFVRRTRGQSDPELTVAVEKLFKGIGAVIEVFVEGTRSRDRRFGEPKTGFLKCLHHGGRTCVIVPITISYECIPDQGVMTAEARSGIRSGMNVGGLLSWLQSALSGKVKLGRVHVSACAPIFLDASYKPDFSELADEIQRRQQRRVLISSYHVAATARLLGQNQSTVKAALSLLGCQFWPQYQCSGPTIPTEPSELCGIMLQCSPCLATLFSSSRPGWSRWLNRVPDSSLKSAVPSIDSLTSLAQSLGKLFDDADQCCRAALEQLTRKGFNDPNPAHILQTAQKLETEIPASLLHASIEIQWPSFSIGISNDAPVKNILDIAQLNARPTVSDEALGFWGFHDSAFVVQMNKKGLPFVTMKGNRYALCGKQMTRLLPFIEGETRIRVNPLNEAFRIGDSRRLASTCQLDAANIERLGTAVEVISVAEDERVRHGTGHSLEDVFNVRSGCPMRVPDAVAWPQSEEEVENILQMAKSQQWCLVPFGGGTNVSQATTCPPLDVEPRPIVSVDMKKMNRVRWVNEEDGLACVEAGITGRDLVEHMTDRGFTIGHEPDSIEFSTLGGWIATKASGMKKNRYGNIEDIVKGVRVAGSAGILRHGLDERSAWGRESSGLDLSSLMLGSEGCLGIITSAVIRIWPLPVVKDYDSILLSDFDHGLHFVRDVSLLGRKSPASCRLLDNEHFRLGQALGPDADSWMTQLQKESMKLLLNWSGSFDRKRVVCITISYEGSQDEVSEQKRAMARLCSAHGGMRLGARVGKAGYDMTFMIAYLRDFAMTYNFLGESFETFAPWSKVAGVVSATKDRIAKEHAARCLPGLPFIGCRVTQLYHEGVCLYFYLCMNFEKVENASHVFSELERAARSEILLQGGSLSHHHGVGKVRSCFLKEINSLAFQGALKALKDGMDPDNIFGARNGAFASS